MNFNIIFNDKHKCKQLNKLGLNILALKNLHKQNRISVNQVFITVYYIKSNIENNEYWIIDDLIDSNLFKNATLFKGIYKYNTNFNTKRVVDILEDKGKKQALLNRFDLIIAILK